MNRPTWSEAPHCPRNADRAVEALTVVRRGAEDTTGWQPDPHALAPHRLQGLRIHRPVDAGLLALTDKLAAAAGEQVGRCPEIRVRPGYGLQQAPEVEHVVRRCLKM